MKKKIIIENLLGIKKCELMLPNKNGVYIIVGTNGSGKSTILTSIDRIANSNAFANNFVRQVNSGKIDIYDNAKIRYFADDEEVYFTKGTNRWSPHPRKNYQQILLKFGYKNSHFIKADANRIRLKTDDINNIKNASITVGENIKNALNKIFSTKKFDNLICIESKKSGTRRQVINYYAIRENKSCFTERRFSTGEIACIRLVESIEKCIDGVILLDEVEMALHPKIQKSLIEYLADVSVKRNLTFFLSTHSPIIINSVNENNIYLVETDEDSNETRIVNPCYQSYAIGCVDNMMFSTYEYIIYVEDLMAKDIFYYMFNRYFSKQEYKPNVICFPTGGFNETVHMAENVSKSLKNGLSKNGHVYAIVDYDVKVLQLNGSNKKFEELYNRNRDIVFWFNFTPEEYIVEQLKNIKAHNDQFLQSIQYKMSTKEYMNIHKDNGRELAKFQLTYLIRNIKSTPGETDEETKNNIIKLVVANMANSEIDSLFNRLFKK